MGWTIVLLNAVIIGLISSIIPLLGFIQDKAACGAS